MTVHDSSGHSIIQFVMVLKRKVTALLMMVLYNAGIITNGKQY